MCWQPERLIGIAYIANCISIVQMISFYWTFLSMAYLSSHLKCLLTSRNNRTTSSTNLHPRNNFPSIVYMQVALHEGDYVENSIVFHSLAVRNPVDGIDHDVSFAYG